MVNDGLKLSNPLTSYPLAVFLIINALYLILERGADLPNIKSKS